MSRIHEALKRAEEEMNSGVSAPVREEEPVSDREFMAEPIRPFPPLAVEVVAQQLPVSEPDPINSDWLASLPRGQWTTDPKKLLFSDANLHNEPGMEEFRTLRSRLYQFREKKPLKCIMFSSALAGEGKTFVSSNLAYALARQHGRKVLLIDADVRKPHMHECLGTKGTPGLTDYLAGALDEQRVVQRGPIDNLFFIAGGKVKANPAELISNGKLNRLIT